MNDVERTPEKFLTVAEVAKMLRISESSVRSRVSRGTLPGVVKTASGKAFSPLRFRKSELLAGLSGGSSE